MSWVAGIDFSTKAVDVVLVDENDELGPKWLTFPMEGADAFDRARQVGVVFPAWDDVLAIGIEQPQMRGSSMATAYALYRVQGAILAHIPRKTLVQPWLPSEWRKAVGLPGNASKNAVGEMVYPYLFDFSHPAAPHQNNWPQDVCDAYCIAVATRSAIVRQEAA